MNICRFFKCMGVGFFYSCGEICQLVHAGKAIFHPQVRMRLTTLPEIEVSNIICPISWTCFPESSAFANTQFFMNTAPLWMSPPQRSPSSQTFVPSLQCRTCTSKGGPIQGSCRAIWSRQSNAQLVFAEDARASNLHGYMISPILYITRIFSVHIECPTIFFVLPNAEPCSYRTAQRMYPVGGKLNIGEEKALRFVVLSERVGGLWVGVRCFS